MGARLLYALVTQLPRPQIDAIYARLIAPGLAGMGLYEWFARRTAPSTANA